MVEFKYGGYHETADLAGKTVAEVRQQYKPELGIPDKARTRLNGKSIKTKLESETTLNDDDKLVFVEKSRRGLVLAGAALITLAVTGGVFAATATSDEMTIEVGAYSDLAAVTEETGSPPSWTAFARYKGAISAATLWEIAPDPNFTGDVLASIYITNGDDLVKVYRAMVLKIEIYNDDGATGYEWDDTDTLVAGPEFLTLSGSEVSMVFAQTTGPYFVRISSGYFSCPRWKSGFTPTNEQKPILFLDVTQASP